MPQERIEPLASNVDTMPPRNTDEAMIKLLKKKIKGFNPYRKARLLQTKANISYLCGQQNIGIKHGEIVPCAREYKTEVVANKIGPAVGNDIAVATKTSPKWDVVPAGTDEDDKATAKAGDNILAYLMRVNRFHEQRKSIVLWYDLDGIGWRKIYWKPDHKVIGENPPAGLEGNIPELEPGAPIFQGEVVTEHVPNTELIYDWRQKKIDKLKWIIHAKTITVGEVKEQWPNVYERLDESVIHDKATKKDSFEAEIMKEFNELSEDIAPSTADPEENELIENDKLVNYYEFWHIKDKNMPVGAYAVALGDPDKLTLAENGPYPSEQYPHGELPFTGYDPLALDGIMVGATSRISQARPLQRYYNQLLSLIKENIDVLGSGIFLAPRESNLDFKKIDFGAANVVEYDQAGIGKPERQPGIQIPGSVFAFVETIAKMIDEIFAFHEPSKGIMPAGGPRSAIGLQVLQEADATQLSPIVRSLDYSDQRAAYQMLSLALANYGDRLLQIVGKDNAWTLFKVNANELNGKVNVIVRTGSSLPMNKTLEMEKSAWAWQSGLLGNPMDPTVRLHVLKVMDLGGFEQLLQSNSKHINFAQKEFINAELLASQAPPLEPGAVGIENGKLVFDNIVVQQIVEQYLFVSTVNEFDDHYTHLQEHTNHLIDKFLEYVGSGNPILQALGWAMRMHIQQHQQIIAQQQMQAMLMENPKLMEGSKDGATKKD